jgi:transcriptional regulator, XRE family
LKDNLEIGNRILSIREDLNYNRDKFSELIGISEAFLGQIERGERSISLNTLIRICISTGFSSDYILFGNESNNEMKYKINKLLNQCNSSFLALIYEMIRSILFHLKQ